MYSYLDPEAAMAFQTHVRMEDDWQAKLDNLLRKANNAQDEREQTAMTEAENFVINDYDNAAVLADAVSLRTKTVYDAQAVLRELGFMEKVSFKEESRSVSMILPKAAFYDFRGYDLRILNRMEYASFVRYREKSKSVASRVKEFDFGMSFPCAAGITQYLSAKLSTVIVTRKAPPHPGKRPANDSADCFKWQERANCYAQFYLMLFRPEEMCYDASIPNTYEYDWAALETFVDDLLNDECVISIFCLITMHYRMKGFFTAYRIRLILSKYRGRNRHMWNEEEKRSWEIRRAWEKREQEINNPVDDFIWSMNNTDLGAVANMRLIRSLNSAADLCQAFQQVAVCDNASVHQLNAAIRKNVVFDGDAFSVQQKGTNLRHFQTSSDSFHDMHAQCFSESPTERKETIDRHNKTVNDLKIRQRQFYDIYERYLKDPSDKFTRPPSVAFLHGCAGTGKSTVARSILLCADLNDRRTVKTAFNGINAVHLKGGRTTASIIHLKASDAEMLEDLKPSELTKFAELVKDAVLIFINEVSNEAPHYLAKLSHAFKVAVGCEEEFGGIPVILAGDYNQLDPVKAGVSFPKGVMQMCEHVWCKNYAAMFTGNRNRPRPTRCKKFKDKHEMENFMKRFAPSHPFYKGTSLIRRARFCELDEQVRSRDPKHTRIVVNMYERKGIKTIDLQNYELLSCRDFLIPNSPWLTAPAIVLTHRERLSLTHTRAVLFAKMTGSPVIRWMMNTKHWAQQPADEHLQQVLQDPCFYEYWILNADMYLTNKISTDLGLVNAQGPFQCHSLCLSSEDEEQRLLMRTETARPGEIITLQQPPLSINVKIKLALFSKTQLAGLRQFRIDDGVDDSRSDLHDFVIPITAGRAKVIERVPVYGSSNFKASRVDLHPYFPLSLNFAITVNRSEGQTLDYVIPAISQREGTSFNFDYKKMYVSLSRVEMGKNMRLLLTGRDDVEKRSSLSYVNNLKPKKESYAMLAGYSRGGGKGWEQDEWNPLRAYSAYHNVKR